MNLTNFHSHCDFCDGRAPMEKFVEQAVSHGFSSYGISSHAPLPFHTRWTMDMEDADAYIAETLRLKEKYAGRIELYAGMEIDYYNAESNPASAFFRGLPLDYRIGAVHFVRETMETDTKADVFIANLLTFYDGDLRTLVTDYFDASMRMVELGGFDFIAHCDKVGLNADAYSAGFSGGDFFRAKVRDLLALCAEKQVFVEVNTKKFSSEGRFFPEGSYFQTIKDLGVKVVVNSDAHYPHLINDGRAEALAALSAAGVGSVMELRGGEWRETPIFRGE